MHFKPGGKGPTRGRAAADKQLSKLARLLLVWLLSEEGRLLASPESRRSTQNRGIPWDLASAAAELGVLHQSASRTLRRLEERRLVACWADGEGTGRKISHIKLSATAVAVATFQRDYGKSVAQVVRDNGRKYREWHDQRYDEAEEAAREEALADQCEEELTARYAEELAEQYEEELEARRFDAYG